jgi:hypothetical protein
MISSDGIQCDSARFIGVRTPWGTMLRSYDDGHGPLWVYLESLGVIGVVRAPNEADAINAIEDEIQDDADPDYLKEWAEENPTRVENGELPDGVSYRPNGAGSNAWNKTALCQEDLNGASIRLLRASDLDELGYTIIWETYE